MKWLCYRHPCPVGVEIRSTEIRLARLSRRTKGNFSLECAEIGHLSSGQRAAVDWTALQELLGRMVRTLGLEGQPAVVSLPAGGVRMQRMPLPVNLPSYAVEAAVQGRLRQEMFGLAGSVCVDYAELAPDKEVYFVASRQELLAQYVECAASAGLEVKIVDVDVFALQRAVSHLYPEPEAGDHVTALLMRSEQSIEWIVNDKHTILLHQLIEREETLSLAPFLAAQISKFSVLYPQRIIQRVIVSGEVDQADVSHAAASCGIVLRYADPRTWMRTVSNRQRVAASASHHLLTACGLSMRELPPWC